MKMITHQEALRQTHALIIPIYEGDALPRALCEALGYDFAQEELGKEGEIQRLSTLGRLPMTTLILAGMGKKEDITYGKAKQLLGTALYPCKQECCVWLDTMICASLPAADAARALGYASCYSTYRYAKARKETTQVIAASDQDIADDLQEGEIIGRCVVHARDLGNTPANLMRPDMLAAECERTARELALPIEIFPAAEIGANALQAVGSGSDIAPRLICITYQGNGDAPFTALVGKGITFDSGGYCLKPRTSMTGMKYDMCGAANALCALELAARLHLKQNVMAVIAAAENKIGPGGYTVDDVIVTLSGKSVEVTNTDAEGRLILCDAITFAASRKAARIIDMATLTGACVTALGERYTGVFANDDHFFAQLKLAADACGEAVWRLPVDKAFHDALHCSTVADLVNAIPKAGGGSCLAAAFLEEFVPEGTPWIHLDIAGSAETPKGCSYAQKGASGIMIETLAKLLSH